jgi:signal transduction histidine kinase
VEFRLDGDPGPLPERVEAALLRIAQGALANVREHAWATRAALTLTCLDDQISLDVADNGRGFDPEFAPGVPDAAGAARPRAARHADPGPQSGARSPWSPPGEGTVVSVAVPLGTPDPLTSPSRP